MMVNEDLVNMCGELRNILGSIKGATKVEEGAVISYMVHVGDEADKANVEAVANELVKQAHAQNLDLEITAVTKQDIEDARARLASLMEKN